MDDFDDLVREDVDNLRQLMRRLRWGQIAALEMGMPVEVVARFRHTDEPVNGFQSLVRLGLIVVDPERRRMRDQNIEGTTIVDPVQQQTGEHAERSQISIRLGMLVCAVRAVADRPAKTADQKFPEPDQFQVQVGTAFHVRQGIFGVVVWVMVARYIKQGDIQHRQQVFQVGVRQVSTPQNQLDLAKVTAGTKIIKALDHLITDGKYLHSGRIVPQNNVPGKGF